MLVHYEGRLGIFDYDDQEFEVVNGKYYYGEILHYIGNEVDGEKIIIPSGIKNCTEMFRDCNSLINPPKIPNGVIYCYGMFQDCTSLITPPKIPNGVVYCAYMFDSCTNLQIPPEIPKTAKDCYGMFEGCKSLEMPPEIPEGVENCGAMFNDCISLKYPPKIPNTVRDCTDMFWHCTSLITPPEIPAGTVRNYKNMFEDEPTLENFKDFNEFIIPNKFQSNLPIEVLRKFFEIPLLKAKNVKVEEMLMSIIHPKM